MHVLILLKTFYSFVSVVCAGTRYDADKLDFKIGMHFIFQIFLTLPQFIKVYDDIMNYLTVECKVLVDILSHGFKTITTTMTNNMGEEYTSLIGVDLHAMKNTEQGLALPFSRKRLQDNPSRLLKIVHVRNGVELMSEIPGLCYRIQCTK